jgi:hypothetical protein
VSEGRAAVATDLRLVIPNQPGRAAQLLAALAEAGVNLDGICGDIRPGETWGFMHLLVEDADTATRIVESQGIQITSRHAVNLHHLENRPGAIAETLRTYREKGENVEVIYTIAADRMVVGTDLMRDEILGVQMKDT